MSSVYCTCETDPDGPCTVEESIRQRLEPCCGDRAEIHKNLAVNPTLPYVVISLRNTETGRRIGDCWHSTGSLRVRVYSRIEADGPILASLATKILMDRQGYVILPGSYCVFSATWPNTVMTAEGVFVTQVNYGLVLRHPV